MMMDVYETVLTTIDENVTLAAVGARTDSRGTVLLTTRTQVATGGKIDKMLAQIKPAKASPLTGLPGGPFVFAAGCPISADAIQPLMDFEFEVLKQSPDGSGWTEEQLKEWKRLTKESLAEYRDFAMVLGPSDTLFGNCTAVCHVENATKYLANYEKHVAAFNKLAKEMKNPFLPTFELEKVQIDGTPALRLEFTVSIPTPVPDLNRMMEAMLGPDRKMVAYVAAADEHTIVVGYGGKKTLRRALQAAKNPKTGLIAAADVATTAALLPDGAQTVILVSPEGIISMINRIGAKIVPPGIPAPNLPKFPATPPVGAALKIVPHQIQTTIVVPPEVFKAVGKFGDAVRKGDLQKLEEGTDAPVTRQSGR